MEPVATLDEAIFLIYPWPEGSILAKLVWEDRNRQMKHGWLLRSATWKKINVGFLILSPRD